MSVIRSDTYTLFLSAGASFPNVFPGAFGKIFTFIGINTHGETHLWYTNTMFRIIIYYITY